MKRWHLYLTNIGINSFIFSRLHLFYFQKKKNPGSYSSNKSLLNENEFVIFRSRDGRIAIWSVDETVVDDQRIVKCEQKSLLELKDSVTTLDFSRYNLLIEEDQYLLAVGFESGKIHLYSWKSSKDSSEQWELIKLLDNRYIVFFFNNLLSKKPKHPQKIAVNINIFFF